MALCPVDVDGSMGCTCSRELGSSKLLLWTANPASEAVLLDCPATTSTLGNCIFCLPQPHQMPWPLRLPLPLPWPANVSGKKRRHDTRPVAQHRQAVVHCTVDGSQGKAEAGGMLSDSLCQRPSMAYVLQGGRVLSAADSDRSRPSYRLASCSC